MKVHRSHVITLLSVALAAILASLVGGGPVSYEGTLETQIGKAFGITVKPGTLVWMEGEPKASLGTATRSNEVAFLATYGSDSGCDMYRAQVRVRPGERLVYASSLHNLTNSCAGDDYVLAASAHYVVVGTRVQDQVRSLTIFDFNGQRFPNNDWSTLQRTLARVTDLQRTGRLSGIGRMNVRFKKPPKDVKLMFLEENSRKSLLVELSDGAGVQQLTTINPETGISRNDDVEAVKEVRLPKQPILWLVDTVRAVPWIGPGPIEWAEGRFFALRDRMRRFAYKFKGEDDLEEDEEGPQFKVPSSEQIQLTSGLQIGQEPRPVPWPPDPIEPPVFKKLKKGEGTWRPGVPEFVRTLPGAPPVVYQTFVRSDIRRPYVRVKLLAMDMRQLNLHMVAGHEDPRSTTGSTGTGRIPRDPKILQGIIAAFNGAFKTEHGAYGMMVERDVLLPPKDDAATIATYDDGSVSMGSWPKNTEIPGDMLSYRQNMDPLVEDGVVNPRRRYLWGFTLDEDIRNMNTIRSGICMHEAGHLIYAWGEDLTARTLGIAMNAAGCMYGMHLDMNPFHTAYVFYRFQDDLKKSGRPEFKGEVIFREMRFSPNRYVNGAPKDFFFVTLKNTSPPGDGWISEGLAQPAPAFMPAIFTAKVGDARVVAADLSRIEASIFPGEIPVSFGPGISSDKKSDDGDLLVEIALGRWSSGRGQISRGAVVATLEQERSTLTMSDAGALGIASWADGSTVANAVQGDWIIQDGTGMSGHGDIVGVGIHDDGWLIICQGRWSAVTGALTELGVNRAISFGPLRSGPGAFVRKETGMVDFAGRAVNERDPTTTTLRLCAAPKHLGGTRL
jgi:hypothetical protein